jgi:hypothetical protein
MADEDKKSGGWERVFDELKDPWDWTAAIFGGGLGAAATIFLHGADLGHSIPTGALGAVGARRAAAAGFRRPGLRKRAKRLLALLVNDQRFPDLILELRDYMDKWELKIISNDKFAKKIDEISEADSNRKKSRYAAPPLPPQPPPR